MEKLEDLVLRCPAITLCMGDIRRAADILIEAFSRGGTLYTVGNGGSSADADHIVGELAKGFLKKRPLPPEQKAKLVLFGEPGRALADGLQAGLPAVSLHSQSALLTAFLNDADPGLVYAQALYALAKPGDVLLALSTSGNSENVVNAALLAKAAGVRVIALTGSRPSKLGDLADAAVRVGAEETYLVQELHLPVYHWLCAAVEEHFFRE